MFALIWMLSQAAVAAENVTVFIGDSHSYFSSPSEARMGAILTRAFPDLNFYGACGSSPGTWVQGGKTRCGWRELASGGRDATKAEAPVPKLSELLRRHKPKRIWIEQGDNMLEWRGTKPAEGSVIETAVRRQIRSLLAEIDGLDCTWIGPTWGGNGKRYHKSNDTLETLYTVLKDELGPRCRLIDSRTLVGSYEGSDGLHLSDEASAEWGTSLVGVLTR